jgi:1-acyl-sn-glycerol-3-phosphate acyltransferase
VSLSGANTLPDVFEVHTGIHPTRRRLRVKRAAGFAYGLYAYGIAMILASACWPVLVIFPVSRRLRWSVVRGAGNILHRLVGISVTISGDMPDGEPVLVVANHPSIVDGLVIILAARKPLTFLVGAVFARQRLVGRFLSGLGCVFVNSVSGSDAVVLTDRFTAMLKQDRSIMSFPEGGLELTPGLREFHLGAFRAAIDANVPVIPVGISGTRSIVAPGARLPRRSAVHVAIGSPICVPANDWKSLIALREEAFSAVAALSCRPT